MAEKSIKHRKFWSFEEYKKWFLNLQRCQGYAYSSSQRTKGISSVKRKIPIDPRLGFYMKKLDCVLGGKPYKKKGDAGRKSSTTKKGCLAGFEVRATLDGQWLEILKVNMKHNHHSALEEDLSLDELMSFFLEPTQEEDMSATLENLSLDEVTPKLPAVAGNERGGNINDKGLADIAEEDDRSADQSIALVLNASFNILPKFTSSPRDAVPKTSPSFTKKGKGKLQSIQSNHLVEYSFSTDDNSSEEAVYDSDDGKGAAGGSDEGVGETPFEVAGEEKFVRGSNGDVEHLRTSGCGPSLKVMTSGSSEVVEEIAAKGYGKEDLAADGLDRDPVKIGHTTSAVSLVHTGAIPKIFPSGTKKSKRKVHSIQANHLVEYSFSIDGNSSEEERGGEEKEVSDDDGKRVTGGYGQRGEDVTTGGDGQKGKAVTTGGYGQRGKDVTTGGNGQRVEDIAAGGSGKGVKVTPFDVAGEKKFVSDSNGDVEDLRTGGCGSSLKVMTSGSSEVVKEMAAEGSGKEDLAADGFDRDPVKIGHPTLAVSLVHTGAIPKIFPSDTKKNKRNVHSIRANHLVEYSFSTDGNSSEEERGGEEKAVSDSDGDGKRVTGGYGQTGEDVTTGGNGQRVDDIAAGGSRKGVNETPFDVAGGKKFVSGSNGNVEDLRTGGCGQSLEVITSGSSEVVEEMAAKGSGKEDLAADGPDGDPVGEAAGGCGGDARSEETAGGTGGSRKGESNGCFDGNDDAGLTRKCIQQKPPNIIYQLHAENNGTDTVAIGCRKKNVLRDCSTPLSDIAFAPMKPSKGGRRGRVKNAIGLPLNTKAKPVAFIEKTTKEKVQQLVNYLTSVYVADQVLKREYKMKKEDLPEVLPQNLVDSAVKLDILKPYLSASAYAHVCKLIENDRKGWNYICTICNIAKAGKFVFCDSCLLWCHYKCVGLSRAPRSRQWFCPQCKGQ